MAGPRPEEPVRWPASLQRWQAMTFLHWAYEPEQLRRLLPPEVGVDLGG